MENGLPISNLKKTYALLGDENFVVNQKNPVDKKIETRATPLNDLINFIKDEIKESLDEVMPIGSIKSYAGPVEAVDSMPGWLLCNGDMVSRVKYKKLYDILGNLYGPAAAGTFRLPDLRGRVIMGFCNGASILKPNFGNWRDSESITLGKNTNNDGNFYHQLNESELPRHSHLNSHTHQYFNIAKMQYSYVGSYGNRYYGADRAYNIIVFSPGDKLGQFLEESKNNSQTFSPELSSYVTETSEAASYTLPAGNNTPHNNMQPYVAINYLIKY